MRLVLLVSLALFVVSCTTRDADELGNAHSAITGGTATSDYPATVALMASDHAFRGQVFCTGTLIARRAVLSAAHCMDPTHVMFGTDPEASGARWVAVSEYIRHPDYSEGDITGVEHDVAIAILAADAPSDVPVIEVATSAPPNGTLVQWVGFGHTGYEANDKGIKRTVSKAVNGTLGRLISTPNASCRADSGGSIYVMDGATLKLAGSDRGSASMCTGDSYFIPCSVHNDWFTTTIEDHGGIGTLDAGVPEADAGPTPTDAGGTSDDAATGVDAGGVSSDGGGVSDDASMGGDASSIPPVRDRSGGCYVAYARTNEATVAFAMMLLFVALAWLRTRARNPQ